MLAQTDYEFAPTLLVLVLELDASRTACHSLGHRDHSVLDKDPREKRRFPQPTFSVGGMRPLDLEVPHHRGDVVDRELPAIQRCIFGDITGWIAPGHCRQCNGSYGISNALGPPTHGDPMRIH